MLVGIALLLVVLAHSCHCNEPLPTQHISTVRVLNEFPRDPKACTQGLVYGGDDTLYESIDDMCCESFVRRVALRTGKVELQHKLENYKFGQGLTLLGDRLYQLISSSKTGFIYDKKSLTKVEQFTHELTDGLVLGLATDGKILFGSDGTSTLYQLDPKTLKVMNKHAVTYNGLEVEYLGALEFVNGEVWAIIWPKKCIVRISPNDGKVIGWILIHSLWDNLISSGRKGMHTINGIAWDDVNNRIFVTGNEWPVLYEIELHPVEATFEGSVGHLCLRKPFLGRNRT